MSCFFVSNIFVAQFCGTILGGIFGIFLQVFPSFFPEYVEMILLYYIVFPIKYHVYCYGYFLLCCSIHDAICHCTGSFHLCRWLLVAYFYYRVLLMDVEFWKIQQFSQSCLIGWCHHISYDTAFHTNWPLFCGYFYYWCVIAGFQTKKGKPPALLRASGSEM